jgi:hypothetical protein
MFHATRKTCADVMGEGAAGLLSGTALDQDNRVAAKRLRRSLVIFTDQLSTRVRASSSRKATGSGNAR